MFAVKVWRNGHSLKEIPLSGLFVVSLILATLFTLFGFSKVVLQRFAPTVVRLATSRHGPGSGISGWGREFSCEYNQIRKVTLSKHDLVPDIRAFLVTLSDGSQVYLAVPDDDIAKGLEILREKGVHCEPPAAVFNK